MSRLDAEALRRGVSNCTIGREIVVLSETTSTNDAILQLAGPNNEEGLVILAESQTAGRGQRGNVWESASGKGLWLSILLRPNIHIKDSPRLTSWAAKIVATTIQHSTLLNAIVKAPNDVYIDGRKVAGVLIEMRAQKNAPHLAIVGIGVNINHTPEDFSETLRSQAISLAMALNRQLDRNEFAIVLLRNLDRTYPAVCSGDFGQNGTAVPHFKR